MKKRVATISFVIALAAGVAASTFYYHSVTTLKRTNAVDTLQIKKGVETISQKPYAQQQEVDSIPPPPPRPPGAPTPYSPPEPPRTLVGATREQLRQLEQYLPAGAQVATYFVGKTQLRAAFTEIDLNSDGVRETVVVHTERPSTEESPASQLFLSVLTPEGSGLKVCSSTRLVEGGVLFDFDVDGVISHLAVKDITGDSRPEIIVAPAIGANLGGAIQVFSIDERLSLQQLAIVGGHYFRVRSGRGESKPSVIMARSENEDKWTTYRWNGESFSKSGNDGT